MESYIEFSSRQSSERDSLPIKFAFNEEQFNRALSELGLNSDDTPNIFSLHQSRKGALSELGLNSNEE